MNYVDIKNLDVGNGFGINVSVYFSGCKFHCLNCQNKDFWDFNCLPVVSKIVITSPKFAPSMIISD